MSVAGPVDGTVVGLIEATGRCARSRSRRTRRWTSTACCSPSRGASAPASRWRSRRWRGWCAAFEPPVYCYHEIVHNQLVVERFETPGRGVRRRHRRRPAGRADHAVGPRLGARGRRRGPGPRQLRRRLGVPARHQGPPRGQGAGRQGLPHRLRRPRGPRGGGRHDGGRARRRSAGSSRWPRSTRSPQFDRAGRAARPDDAVAPRLGRRRRRGHASASPTCGRRAAATCASPPPTASRR